MQEQNRNHLPIVCEKGCPRFANQHKIPNWKQGPTLFEAVNHLFRSGWELVNDPVDVNQKRFAYHPNRAHRFRRPRK
jgi:hypothetical protein